MSEVYYKIVRNENGRLFSCNAINKFFCVEYKQGEAVTAPDYLLKINLGLCVFDNQGRAEDFLRIEKGSEDGNCYRDNLELWECETGDKCWPTAHKVAGVDIALDEYTSKDLDDVLNDCRKSDWMGLFPYETIMTDSVILTKKVEGANEHNN